MPKTVIQTQNNSCEILFILLFIQSALTDCYRML